RSLSPSVCSASDLRLFRRRRSEPDPQRAGRCACLSAGRRRRDGGPARADRVIAMRTFTVLIIALLFWAAGSILWDQYRHPRVVVDLADCVAAGGRTSVECRDLYLSGR